MGTPRTATGDQAWPRFGEDFLEEETLNCFPKDGWVENRVVDKHLSGGDLEMTENQMSVFLPQGLCTRWTCWLKCFPPTSSVTS